MRAYVWPQEPSSLVYMDQHLVWLKVKGSMHEKCVSEIRDLKSQIMHLPGDAMSFSSSFFPSSHFCVEVPLIEHSSPYIK
jgi:hypothetical protein